MGRATALLFPSRWAEPLARTLLEAQAVGAPTIALDTGGTRDVIEHDYNGLLAENETDFSAQIARLVADEALQQRLRANAKQVAANRFSPDKVLPQFEQLYAAALEKRAVAA
jgi:glycosyltransferase involved in cell wall biosynthesis